MKKLVLYLLLFMSLFFSKSIYTQNYWQQTNGPYGGKIKSLGVNSKNFLYAVSGKHLYRSTDSGNSWTIIENGLGSDIRSGFSIDVLIVNSNDRIFVGISSATRGFVYFSTDNGDSWKWITPGGLKKDPIDCLASNSKGQLFASAGLSGLFCWSEDSLGWTESQCNLTTSGIGWIESMAIDQNDVLYAGTILKGIFRSTDNGNNWISVNNGLKTNTIYSIAISPMGSIFASMDDGIYRSKDGGDNWFQVSSIEDITSLTISSNGLILAGYNGETKGNLYLSDNDGTIWKKIDDGLSNKFILSIVTNSNNQIFVGTYGGGVFFTNDIGKTWINTNEGIIDPFITKLITNSTGSVFAGTDQGIYRSDDNGDNWIQINNGLENDLGIQVLTINSNNNLFALGYHSKGIATKGGLYYSTNSGEAWVKLCSNGPDITDIVFDSSGNFFAASIDEGILFSSNGGLTWSRKNNGIPDSYGMYKTGNCILLISDTIYTGFYWNGIYRTTNLGNNWFEVNNGIPIGYSNSVYCLGRNTNGHIFAGADSGLYRLNEDSNSWILLNDGLTYNTITHLATSLNGIIFVIGIKYLEYYLENYKGVYFSTDNGEHWIESIDGLPYYDPYCKFTSLAVQGNGDLFCGTDIYGIYRCANPTIVVDDKNLNIPSAFNLNQNYPNPFNPTTTMKYSIPKTSFVTIKVYDVLGKEVVTLVHEEKPEGNYQVDFLGSGLASGIYFYRMQAGEFVETKKFVLLK